MSLTDFFYKDKPYLPSGKPLYHVDIYEDIIEEKENNEFLITLALNKKTKSAPPVVPGKKYLIQQRFLDWNSSRVSGRIMEIDQEEEPSCVKLIENPMEYMKKIKDKDGIKKKAEAMIKDHFTESQKDAFYHVLNYNLSLIWGPPGTGKTYFLAVSLLIMLEAYRKAGKPLKIMISAFTHPAIENCLKKIYQLNEEKKIWKEELFAVKLDYVKTQGCEGILQVIKKENCPEYLSSHDRCIIGGTTYSLLKPFKDDNTLKPFDILVIDEGSQLRVPESLLVISRLKEDGRLIIAGDDKQLPPIIKGIYPELEDGEPLLHSSIFDTLREADCDDGITCQLLENFRMNETLCLYPALGIYGTDYTSVNKKVAGRKIYLHKKTSDDFIKKVVDPKYPLVVCISDGITVGAENKAEADLVAYIACYLRENLCDKDTRTPYNTDEKFWKDGLFIVSPHHVQIRAIKAALSERRVYNPFVDTVEKMQGQEADAVIVSYGVADAELAMMEGEFIYNLNRLNVAITRGKAKVIVFLSRNLLTPDLQIMEDPEAAAGISYMTGLEQFASEGEGWDFDMDEGATLTVYRR
ncbi:MAG: DEAD/DEAH box helicase [Candidatus Eremiobacterota bacterium]